jgi:hypothetical protein
VSVADIDDGSLPKFSFVGKLIIKFLEVSINFFAVPIKFLAVQSSKSSKFFILHSSSKAPSKYQAN